MKKTRVSVSNGIPIDSLVAISEIRVGQFAKLFDKVLRTGWMLDE